MLDGNTRRELRKAAHLLKPFIVVGMEGLTENVLKGILDYLKSHELGKVSFSQNCPVSAEEGLEEISKTLGVEKVMSIGRIAVFYLEKEHK